MPTTAPTPAGKGTPPPISRRSARQRRLASREASRAMSRAGSSGGSNDGLKTIMLWSVVAVVIGVVVIGGAWMLTKQPSDASSMGSPIPPTVVTPADVKADGRTLGNADAKVTIDIYEDYRCIYCFDFTMSLEPKLIDSFIKTGKAKLVYHDYITIDAGDSTESRDAAAAALCADDQGKFWPMHDWLFVNQAPRELPGAFSRERLDWIAQGVGLDMGKFKTCMDQGTHNAQIAQAQKDKPSDLTGTPAIYVNGKLIPYTGDDAANLKAVGDAIEGILNPTPSPAPSASASASATPAASAS